MQVKRKLTSYENAFIEIFDIHQGITVFLY